MRTGRLPLLPLLPLLVVLALLAGLAGLAGCDAVDGGADAGTVAAARTATPATPAVDVVALGDSVVAGTACDCETFVQRYAKLVADRTGARVRWQNDGVGGQTSSDLLAELRSPGGAAADVGRADVVLITIGANDLGPALTSWQDGGCAAACMRQDLPRLGRNIAAIVARVHQLDRPAGGRQVLIGVTDYWNVFEDGQVADRDYGRGFAAWSDRITRLANAAICSAAAPGSTCVDLYAPFTGHGDPTGLLADDGDHPDAAGHQVIAEALAATVMPTGRTPAAGG